MKKALLSLCLLIVAFCGVGCGGGDSSSSITGSSTSTTTGLTLKANLGTGTTFSSSRAAVLSSSLFKFRVKAVVSGEPTGSWITITATANTDGTLSGVVNFTEPYTEFLMELLDSSDSAVVSVLHNTQAAGNTTMEASPLTTAQRIAFEEWKTNNNPVVRTYNNFILNLDTNQSGAITSVSNSLAANLSSYTAYLAGETTTVVLPLLKEWSNGSGFSTTTTTVITQLKAIAATVTTTNRDTSSANSSADTATNTPIIPGGPNTGGTTVPPGTNPGTNTGTSTGIFTATTSTWPSISGSSSTLEAAGKPAPYTFVSSDSDSSYNTSGATIVSLNNDGTTISGSGATFANNVVTITTAGTYVLSGNLNGHIFVSGKLADGVTLVLNGVNISGQTHAAIYSEKKSTPVTIILPSGTINTLSDATKYTYADDDEPGACLFVKGDLLIKGSGTLTINGNSEENGIQSKGETKGLVITGGTINVTSAGNGIKAKMIAISNGTFNVTVSGDGECLESTETYIYIENGSFNLESRGGDAIKAENDYEDDTTVTPDGDVYIAGGNFKVTAFGDGIQATDLLVISGGTFNFTTTNAAFEAQDESSKGIKTGTDNTNGSIIINGGDFTFNTTDHAIKSKGTIDITGYPAIKATPSLGKGISGTGNVTIGKTGEPKVYIYNGEEGIESKAILSLEGGDIRISTPLDDADGLNAGGTAGDGTTHLISISGGYIYVESNGDGVDTNSDLSISGGLLVSNANPLGIANAAIDTDQGNFKFSGGTFIGLGPSSMAHSPDSSYSSVPSMAINFSVSVPKGSLIHIRDSSQNEIITCTGNQDSNSLVFGSTKLSVGETYSIYTGGTHSGFNKDGVYSGGSYSGGTLYTTATLTSIANVVGTPDPMPVPPGGMGGGGMPPTGLATDTLLPPPPQGIATDGTPLPPPMPNFF